ncbi:MAG TPA: serine/threonine-protein kinase, partial [Planctomycetaceae bacterium]|nr:serine/threonine-protein kinase [Planctomycetaceae bacterium]
MTESTTCPQCGSPLSAQALHGICPRCLLQAGFESRPISPAGSNEEATYVGGSPAAPQPEEVAALFPQLEILELLGRGGMGAVYKARQRDLHRIVALKILPPELARDPAFGERFVREARALASLNHPHIVTIYDFGQTQGVYYLLMEYVDGVNLRQAQQAGKIEPEQVLGIVSQVCEALQYAHEEGVVHRDIKPENILLDRRGRVKIADFGLAKLVRNQPADLPLTQTQQVMGTLHYMAPEQLERPLQVDHRADIFSLGVVFYELLTGELPLGRFETPSHKVQVDVRLDEIVLRALERNPERRYQWASQVKTELDTVSHTPGPRPMPAATPPVPVSADQRAVANRLRIPAIGLCIIGAITCAVPLGMTVALFVVALGHSHGGVGLGPIEVLLTFSCVPVGVLLIVGSLQMLRLNSYSWAMATAILGVIPCAPFFFISLPLSIWALFVLSQDETQAAFEQRRQQRSVKPGSADASINLTGIGLLLSGGLQLLGGLALALIVPWVAVGGPNAVPSVAGLGMFLVCGALCLVCSLLMIIGGMQLLGRGSWGLAKAGAIAALIPLGPWWLIGFPCGLCALLVLYKPGVMELFKSSGSDRETPSRSAMSEAPSAAQPSVGWSELRARLMIPAIGLICAAIVQVLFTVYVMAQVGDAPGPFVRSAMTKLAPLLIISLVLSVLMGLGGL